MVFAVIATRIELLNCQQNMLVNLLYTMVSLVIVVGKNVTLSRPTSFKTNFFQDQLLATL